MSPRTIFGWHGRVLALSALLVLTVAACGDGGDGADDPTPAPPIDRPPAATATAQPTSTPPPPDPTATPAPPADTATAMPPAATDTPAPPTSTPPKTAAERTIGEVAGVTFLVGDGSEATFTVREKLANLPLPNDAVMRTTALSGEVHFDGRPSVITIDLHKLGSDQERRDRYVRERMFPNDPVATFTLPDAGSLPKEFTDGETAIGQVTGQLDIRGFQAPVAFEIEARDDGDVVYILGRTTFTWEDLGLAAPNLSFVQVEDEVHVEILIAARPAA